MLYNCCLMLSLAVDTSTPSGSLAVLKDAELLGSVMTCSSENYSSRMFRHLDFLLADLNLKVSDFDLFSVNTGPGSFTGLRVGLTAVKGWAELFTKPIAAISGLEAVASMACAPESLIAAVLDARRGEFYGAVYHSYQSIEPGGSVNSPNAARVESRLERIGSEMVMPAERFIEYVRQIVQERSSLAVVFATPTPGVLSQALANWPERDCTIHEIPHLLAPAVGRLGYFRAQRDEVVDAIHLDANYIRRTDAELLWKGDQSR